MGSLDRITCMYAPVGALNVGFQQPEMVALGAPPPWGLGPRTAFWVVRFQPQLTSPFRMATSVSSSRMRLLAAPAPACSAQLKLGSLTGAGQLLFTPVIDRLVTNA